MPEATTRRSLLATAGAAIGSSFLPTLALAVPRTVTIGLMTPATGRMATFHQPVPFILDPASDRRELKGVPRIGSVCPQEAWFFGRGGDPKTGFE